MASRGSSRPNLAGLVLCLVSIVGAVHPAVAGNAPLFKGRGLDREPVHLDRLLKEGPVLIVFWATCCSNTIVLMHHMDELHQKYGEHGFSVLGVAENDSKTVSQVKPWVTARKLTFPIVLDPDGKVMRLYHVQATPHLILVDQERLIRFTHSGFIPGDEQTCEAAICGTLAIPCEGEAAGSGTE